MSLAFCLGGDVHCRLCVRGEVALQTLHRQNVVYVLLCGVCSYQRRSSKIATMIASQFSSAFVFHWVDADCFGGEVLLQVGGGRAVVNTLVAGVAMTAAALQYPPSFDGRCVCYPTDDVRVSRCVRVLGSCASDAEHA